MPAYPAAHRLGVLAALVGMLALGLACSAGPATSVPVRDCSVGTMQDHAKAASAVFVGTVTGVQDSAASNDANVIHGFDQQVMVERVYKGAVRTENVDVRTSTGKCGLGQLAKGASYLFFVSGSAPSSWIATGSGGTEPSTPDTLTQVRNLLGGGHLPVPPAPPTATLTPVDHSAPASFLRDAAPGIAMVGLGLLGLLVFTVLARRRPA